MSEKATLLPTVIDNNSQSASIYPSLAGTRLVIVPGLEFDPRKRFNYGYSALFAFILTFLSWLIVESRSCYNSYWRSSDFDQLQAIHVAIIIFSFVLFLLSLFGFADFIFQYKIFFLLGVLTVYIAAGIMIWAVYQAAVTPCLSSSSNLMSSQAFATNVFGAGDGFGIVILLLNIVASVLLVSAASSFYKRH